MVLTATIKKDCYSYETFIDRLDSAAINTARKLFLDFKSNGIILNDSFDDLVWLITNEARKCSIDFRIEEVAFERNCRSKLGCNLQQYAVSIRVLITMLFGSSILTLQKTATSLRKLVGVVAGNLKVDVLFDDAEIVIDFIDLLPGETFYKNELRDKISDIHEYTRSVCLAKSVPRELSTYQSYFRFFECVDLFWAQATTEEKLLYFPVYLWWNLTAILPLRPSEFVLIPRECLVEDGDRIKLMIRRTRLKGKRLNAEYRIDKDYDLHNYDITNTLADGIRSYISGTEPYDCSDIGTLLCAQYQYRFLDLAKSNNSAHYTYGNLRDCLRYFHNRILQDKMGFNIIGRSTEIGNRELCDDEIERITLGDTRHLAMINLIVSGGNPLICKELAGHNDINISANYYANIKNFVEVLSFTQYKRTSPRLVATSLPNLGMTQNTSVLMKNARCSSERVANGYYSDCLTAINASGELLDCHSCKYYRLPRGAKKTDLKSLLSAAQEREKDMRNAFDLLVYAVERVRRGLGYHETLQSALLHHQAAVLQYKNALVRQYEMEEI